ncbi:MAG TPA: hypothetical protein VKI20_09210 [Acidimicrobiales bacterium]|nr:hypothetical protein [Acidimicrobiales bacterium]
MAERQADQAVFHDEYNGTHDDLVHHRADDHHVYEHDNLNNDVFHNDDIHNDLVHHDLVHHDVDESDHDFNHGALDDDNGSRIVRLHAGCGAPAERVRPVRPPVGLQPPVLNRRREPDGRHRRRLRRP